MPDPKSLNPLTVLNRRYVIVRRLHRGDLGAVYLAKDRALATDVAIKELVVDPSQRESTIARFERYAEQWRNLQHPSIPRIHDFFYVEEFGRFYVVMEYVVGSDLASLRLSSPNGRLPESTVTELGIQVSSALRYLHTQSTPIIYQNLKPARVMVTSVGKRVMLMPWFGRWTKEEKAGAAVGGTMGYAPPEFFSGSVSPATDVYSLGASMFQLLTGVDPQDDPLVIFDFTKNPRPRQIESSISFEMEEILMRTVDYRPEDRFSAEELQIKLLDLHDILNTGNSNSESPEEHGDEWESIAVDATRGEPASEKPQIYLDENVQFTVFRPGKIKPLKWYPLLAYAHLTERREDDEDAFDPIAQVQQDAERIMRDQNLSDYRQTSEDSRVAVPRKGEISFVPFIHGVEFNPSRASFYWEESVHRQEFRMRAPTSFDGKTVRGTMSVFLGAILLAEINLTIQVRSDSQEVHPEQEKPARPYRRIFPSYSHKDREIVSQLEHYAQITGDRYMRDVFELRSGQNWKKWMADTIEGADIFQLFWSTNSMRSENVRLEWECALRLNREHFIRPTYWETPLPGSPSENLPPLELRDLHFQHVRPPAYKNDIATVDIESDDWVGPKPGDGYQPTDGQLPLGGDQPTGCAVGLASLFEPIAKIIVIAGVVLLLLLLIVIFGFFFWRS